VCVCSLSYPASKSRLYCAILYSHLWAELFFHIFPHYLINDMILRKKIINAKCVLIPSYSFCLKHFSFYEEISEARSQTLIGLDVKPRYFGQIYMTLVYSRQIFEKSSSINVHKNLSRGTRVVPCGRTDRHDEANSRFSQFCEQAYKFLKILHRSCYQIAVNNDNDKNSTQFLFINALSKQPNG